MLVQYFFEQVAFFGACSFDFIEKLFFQFACQVSSNAGFGRLFFCAYIVFWISHAEKLVTKRIKFSNLFGFKSKYVTNFANNEHENNQHQ